ncbi:cupin domain-containing protein [Methylocapsa acidiphila]|uniref:cupin domain-containing protein n=1 Tax=Methylocapsa acidiphila TaxID=133552 RepID=UPI000407CA14|nr:cupin domain-containing protein [Methylocapsa acidiphila]
MQKSPFYFALLIAGVSPAFGEDAGKPVKAGSLEWTDAPPVFPSGAKAAIVSGDPAKEGPFVVRLQMPANYKIQAHHHPTAEYVTVLAGDIHFGMGDKFDGGKGQELGAGDFIGAPAEMNHYAWTMAGATIQVHGQGPFTMTYADPADDPSKR